MPRLARTHSPLLLCLLLAVLHTWPIARSPAHASLNGNADAETFEWTLAWLARGFVHHPTALTDGNIFAPEPHVLLYADPLIVPALLAAPVLWLGGSPVLGYNISLLVGLTLTAWAGWLVACRWTGSSSTALVAGALVAFNGHLLTRLAHIPAAHMWGVPLSLWLADRLLDRPTGRGSLALAVIVAATAITSAYTLALVGVCVAGALLIAAATRRWRAAVLIGSASAAGLIAAGPVLWPYARFAAGGVSRPLEQVAQLSATLPGYLTSLSHLHAAWSARFLRDDVNVFFAGITAIVLALAGVGLALGLRSGAVYGADRPVNEHARISIQTIQARRRRMILLLVTGAAGVVLSLGPATALYRWLYEWVTPLRGLRAAARFGYLYLVAIGLAAAYGLADIEQRLPSRLLRRVAVACALGLVTVEAWSGPVPTRAFTRVPGIYDNIARVDTPVLLVEVPFYPVDTFWGNGEYVLNSTAHWRPLMNGYSGYVPDSYRRRAAAFWFFPEDWAIDAMKREGATHLMVHLEKFTPSEVAAIEAALPRRTDLVLTATDTQGHRLFQFR